MAQAIPFVLMAASAAGPIIQGIGANKAGKQNQKIAYGQALEEERAGNEDILRIRGEARRKIGEQAAGQWANGFTGDSGSALDYIRESQINAALDVMERRRDMAGRAKALREEGDIRRSEGKYALASGILQGVTGALSVGNDWAQARQGSTGGGMG